MKGVVAHKLGDVIAGHNFMTFTCPGCNTTTLLTPAGGELRECQPECPERAMGSRHPGYHVQQFLLRGAVCELVGEHHWHDISPEAAQRDPNPEDADEPGDWTQNQGANLNG